MIFKCKEGLTFPIALVKKGLQIVWDEKIVTNRGSEVLSFKLYIFVGLIRNPVEVNFQFRSPALKRLCFANAE